MTLTVSRLKDPSSILANSLQALATTTFIQTYESGVPLEALMNHASEEFSSEKISQEILDDDIAYFIALIDGVPAGYLKMVAQLGPGHNPDPQFGYLERNYLLKQFQGRQIGTELITKGMAWAQNRGLKKIWLRVWHKNSGAIEFYNKRGFKTVGTAPFKLKLNNGECVEETNFLMVRGI